MSQTVSILSSTALFILLVGSIAYKMIGVETINSIQFLLLIVCNSQSFSYCFYLLSGLSPSFGNLSAPFQGECQLSPVFCRLGYFNSPFEAFTLVASIEILVLVAFILLRMAIYFKEEKKTNENGNAKPTKALRFLIKAKQLLYDVLLYPSFMGFMPILLVTGLNIDLGYLPQSSTRMFAVCYAILFGAFSVIFFNEIFNNENKMVPKLTVITKKQYTSYYHCYSVLIVALIQAYFITKK